MREVTRERLEEIVRDPMINQGSEFAMMARMALAAMDSEPVAWISQSNLHSDARFSMESKIGNWSPEDINEYEISETPLYRHAQQPVDSEPVGYLFHNEYGAVLYSISDDATEGFSLIGPIYSVPQPAPKTEREPIAWLNDAYLARGVVDGEAGSEDAGPGYIPVYREASPAQPVPVVPDEMTIRDACKFVQDMRLFDDVSVIVMRTWNACRAAILNQK